MKKRRLLPLLSDVLSNVDRLTRQLGESAAAFAYSEKFGATCSSSCNGCCYQHFTVSFPEGLALAAWLVEQGRVDAVMEARLASAAMKMNAVDPHEHFLAQIPCAFLVDESCSVYEARPLTCRMYFVRSDPTNCHPKTYSPEKPREGFFQDPWIPTRDAMNQISEEELAVRPRDRGVRASLPAMVLRGLAYLRERKELGIA